MPMNLYKNSFIVKPSLKLSMSSVSKTFSLLLIVLLVVLSLMMAKPAFAAEISMRIEPSAFQTTYVNQPVNITAIPTSGTPPYTYQWYTQLWNSTEGSPIGSIVAFSGATSSTFKFVESTSGTYDISLNISDSAGNGDYDSFPISGVWVIVQPLSASSPTPTPTTNILLHGAPKHSPTIPEFPTWIILPLFAVVILLSTVFVRKRMTKKYSPTPFSFLTF